MWGIFRIQGNSSLPIASVPPRQRTVLGSSAVDNYGLDWHTLSVLQRLAFMSAYEHVCWCASIKRQLLDGARAVHF